VMPLHFETEKVSLKAGKSLEPRDLWTRSHCLLLRASSAYVQMATEHIQVA
jgi:hypothetical protein